MKETDIPSATESAPRMVPVSHRLPPGFDASDVAAVAALASKAASESAVVHAVIRESHPNLAAHIAESGAWLRSTATMLETIARAHGVVVTKVVL